MPEITAVIVGSKNYDCALDALQKMNEGDVVRLEREPANSYDRNAVACHFLGIKIGFIPKVANPPLAAAMDAGAQPVAIVRKVPIIRGRFVQQEPLLQIAWRDG